ncbi:MAG: ABC transporter ATP-binding protein, partial [Anaerolineales bacterium]
MGEVAIRVEKLSKQYYIGGPQKTYSRLGDQIIDVLSSPFKRAGKLLSGQASGATELDETIWALKDVSFEVGNGEVVGIIGRNGA